jgi:putative membrane protein
MPKEEGEPMRRDLVLCLTFAGGSLCLISGIPARAQGHGGGAPMSQPANRSNPNDPNSSLNTNRDMQNRRTDDKKFLQNAAIGDTVEVELGKLAVQKASSDAVKQFAQKMVDDHTKANEELKQIASKANINVPDSLDSKHQSRVDKLSKLSGTEFDRAYIKDQLKDHQQDVKEFQNEAENGNHEEVKNFASKTLPTLQEHLSMAKDLNKQKGDAAMK